MQYYLHVVLLGISSSMLGISSSMLEMLNVLQSEMLFPRTSLLVNINSVKNQKIKISIEKMKRRVRKEC